MNFEKSADTKILINVLGEAAVGQVVTYDQMSAAIGRDVRQFAFNAMRSARLVLLREKQYVFGVETRVGLKRLDDSQIVDASESDRRRLKRTANRAINKLAVVNFGALTDDKKKQHTVASAQMGAIAMFSGKAAANKISSAVNASKEQLAIGETLKLFG